MRRVDYTGVSGVGVVAYGVVFSDGHVALRWVSSHPATSTWNSVDDLLAVHGHDHATTVQWIDQVSDVLDDLAGQSSQRPRRSRRDSPPATPASDPSVAAPASSPTDADQPRNSAANGRPSARPALGDSTGHVRPLPNTEPLKVHVDDDELPPDDSDQDEPVDEAERRPVRRNSGRHRRTSRPIDLEIQ